MIMIIASVTSNDPVNIYQYNITPYNDSLTDNNFQNLHVIYRWQ